MKNNAEIIAKAVWVRKKLDLENTKPINIFTELEKKSDFTIVFIPLSENIRGFSHNERGHKIIVINANDTEPQKNFSCAHELYHLYFDYNDNNELSGNLDERKADQFAAIFLVPQECLFLYFQDKNINPQKITQAQLCEMERYFGVSRKALVIRLMEENIINKSLEEKLCSRVKANAAHCGFDTKYYEQNKDKFETIGEYIKLAEDLYQSGKISKSKYDNYLLDAFREDIVYHLPKRKNDKD